MTLDIPTIARAWLGTPYHHQAAVRGVGCDCVGLLRGVYAEAFGVTPDAPSDYSPNLPRAMTEDTITAWILRYCVDRSDEEPAPGWAVAFRAFDRPDRHEIAVHCGIMIANDRFVHAAQNRGAVVETPLRGRYREAVRGFYEPVEPWLK